jgi:GTP cyclohydrolase II
MSKLGRDGASVIFGTPSLVGVTRGLAEFRAGRPVEVVAETNSIVALPVEGLTPQRLTAFQKLFGSATIRLAVTNRRAQSLGIDTSSPVSFKLAHNVDAEAILRLAANAVPGRHPAANRAGPAAAAALELAKLAQVLPAVLLVDAITAVRARDVAIVQVCAHAIAGFHRERARLLSIAADAEVPLASGIRARFVAFLDPVGEAPVAVIIGCPDMALPTPVRLHSACLTGDAFGSRRCDCGDQLCAALDRLVEMGGGIVLYLPQEGRGLGLANKMRAYQLQDTGFDTVDANTTLGFDDDERHYNVAARMLEMLGCKKVVLLTNNPAKIDGLAKAGIGITGRVSLETPIHSHNRRYLTAKATRSGHRLERIIASHPPASSGLMRGSSTPSK